MSDRILVTGGAGFIGSHACERLADEGHEVWVLDNFDDHYSPALKRRNVAELVSRPSVRLVEGDVRDPVLLGGLFTDADFDAVVHLAARPGVPASVDDPDACYEVNVRGALRLMEAMTRHGVAPIVLASSSSSSAEPGRNGRGDAAAGSGDRDRPATPHAASQRSAELLAHAYHRTHGLSVHSLRLPTVYGPRQRPDQRLHRLARRLEAGGRSSARDDGDGDVPREYLYVSDAAAALCLSVERLLASNGAVWQTVDVPGSARLTAREASSALAAAMEVSSPVDGSESALGSAEEAPAPEGLPEFRPEVGLEEGLARFIAWLRSEEAPVSEDSAASAAHVTARGAVPVEEL